MNILKKLVVWASVAFTAVVVIGLLGNLLPASGTLAAPDYTNAASVRCVDSEMQNDVNDLWKDNTNALHHTAPRALYIKNVREVSRSKDELICEGDITATQGYFTGRYQVRYHNENGKSYVGLRSVS